MPREKINLEELEVGCVNSHFLDSGSFTLWTRAAAYAKEKGCGQWDFYETKEFWQYMDEYAAFIKKYQIGIDLYANVDVIPNPELTWRNQKYLEKNHELKPVPVVHYTTDLDWLKFYIRKGYDPIALGGLVGSTSQDACRDWLDRAFEIVCDGTDCLPKVRIHGFGVTTYSLLLRYPWWSVDSTSWTKVAAYGGILVPHKRRGAFTFAEEPYLIKVSDDSPDRKSRGKHIATLTGEERKIVKEWLAFINIPFGKNDEQGEVVRHGVVNRHSERKAANLYFFEHMRKSLPDYPWPFTVKTRRGFGLL